MKKLLPICILVLFSIIFLSISKNENKKLEVIKKGDTKDIIIASYINGVYTDEMPTESKYFGYVECKNSSGKIIDSLGFVTWENNKWNVKVTDMSASGTCNVYFINPPMHWLDAEDGTLLKAIKDNNKVENVKSIPGKQINKEDEAVLSGTFDDYGTSYYFRGNVKNNYVQFAGKCWKIVRITGDGAIKLFLWNNSVSCTSKNVPTTSFNGDITYNKDAGGTGNLYQTASGVGFMYGKPDSNILHNSNNTGAQDNINDSTILTNLKTWYDTTFNTSDELNPTKYTNLLADVIWCGDKSVYSGKGLGEYGASGSRFKASPRINNPNLVCETINANKNVSKYTALDTEYGNGTLKTSLGNGTYKYYKIGLITLDEATFAGGRRAENSKYYLYTNSIYWTMTPFLYDGLTCNVGYVQATGGLLDYRVNYKMEMRPMVALNYNVEATYDTTSEYAPGTANNPYIIN